MTYCAKYQFLKRSWPVKGSYLAYKMKFDNVNDFITLSSSRGECIYTHLPEMARMNEKTCFRFVCCGIAPLFALSRNYDTTNSIFDNFDF